MQPSLRPSDHPESKSPPPPPPGFGYYAAAPPPGNGNGAAAYPYYPAPQPHQQSQRPYPYPYPPAAAAPANLRRLLAFVVAGCVLLLLAAAGVTVWLVVLRPRTPFFSLTALDLTGVAYAPTTATLSATFDAAVLASNPNPKLVVTYFNLLASFSTAPGYSLAVASLPPVTQAPGNTTALAFRVAAQGAYVGPPGDDGAAAFRSGGAAEVDVDLAAWAMFERGSWRVRRKVMRVACGRVPVVFRGINSTEASFTGPAMRCNVFL